MSSLHFFVDFDHTLFDSNRFKQHLTAEIEKLAQSQELVATFWMFEKELRSLPHYISEVIKQTCEKHGRLDLMDDLQALLLNVNFAEYLFPEVKESLRKMQSFGKIFIFSQGDQLYQQVKIHKTGISEFVEETFIFSDKMNSYPQLVSYYPNGDIWFLDNHLTYLKKAKDEVPRTVTIWVKRDEYGNDDNFTPDHTISDFDQLVKILIQLGTPRLS